MMFRTDALAKPNLVFLMFYYLTANVVSLVLRFQIDNYVKTFETRLKLIDVPKVIGPEFPQPIPVFRG